MEGRTTSTWAMLLIFPNTPFVFLIFPISWMFHISLLAPMILLEIHTRRCIARRFWLCSRQKPRKSSICHWRYVEFSMDSIIKYVIRMPELKLGVHFSFNSQSVAKIGQILQLWHGSHHAIILGFG